MHAMSLSYAGATVSDLVVRARVVWLGLGVHGRRDVSKQLLAPGKRIGRRLDVDDDEVDAGDGEEGEDEDYIFADEEDSYLSDDGLQ